MLLYQIILLWEGVGRGEESILLSLKGTVLQYLHPLNIDVCLFFLGDSNKKEEKVKRDRKREKERGKSWGGEQEMGDK
jgi:hypothetical protein